VARPEGILLAELANLLPGWRNHAPDLETLFLRFPHTVEIDGRDAVPAPPLLLEVVRADLTSIVNAAPDKWCDVMVLEIDYEKLTGYCLDAVARGLGFMEVEDLVEGLGFSIDYEETGDPMVYLPVSSNTRSAQPHSVPATQQVAAASRPLHSLTASTASIIPTLLMIKSAQGDTYSSAIPRGGGDRGGRATLPRNGAGPDQGPPARAGL
jgi:hypothetical protein